MADSYHSVKSSKLSENTVKAFFGLVIACCLASAPSVHGADNHIQGEGLGPSPFLYVWAGDVDDTDGGADFLAVIDADPDSPRYGEVLSTSPVGSSGNNPHHAEPIAPASGFLFANGFEGERTFLFDLSVADAPVLAGEIEPIRGYRYLHSLVRLPNGNVLATIQKGDGSEPGDAGGLAEFNPEGQLLRVSSAKDPNFPDAPIRPYALDIFPDVNRVVTTSNPMQAGPSKDLVQFWRLSDLALIASIEPPRIPPQELPECELTELRSGQCKRTQVGNHYYPFEVRRLANGTAFINTAFCGFYRVLGLESESPRLESVYSLPDRGSCAVPTLVDDIWVMPMVRSNEILTLDISDASRPRELARTTLTEPFLPHWSQADPGTNRIAVTGLGPAGMKVIIFWVDTSTGRLTVDNNFGGSPDSPGVSMDRATWPHGATGTARPHAALFGR